MSQHPTVRSLVDRAGDRLRAVFGDWGPESVFSAHVGRAIDDGIWDPRPVASLVLTQEYGQGSYVAGWAALDDQDRVIRQGILGPGWSVDFEPEPEAVELPVGGEDADFLASLAAVPRAALASGVVIHADGCTCAPCEEYRQRAAGGSR